MHGLVSVRIESSMEALLFPMCHFLYCCAITEGTGTGNIEWKECYFSRIPNIFVLSTREHMKIQRPSFPLSHSTAVKTHFSRRHPPPSPPVPYTRRRERTPDFLVIRSPDESIEICVGQEGRTQKGARSATERHSVCSSTAKLYRRVILHLGFVGMDTYRIIRRTFDRKREKLNVPVVLTFLALDP